jgi:hypothetical protein
MSVKGDKMKSRLLNQFTVSTRLAELLDVINNRFDDSDDVLDYLLYYRFLSTASGVWLDEIGATLGLTRPYTERADIFTYKSIGEADDTTLAWSDVAGSTGGVWTTLNGSPTATLVSDTIYRALLEARIYTMYAEPTIPNIYTFIKLAFSNTESIVTVPTPGLIEVELVTALTNIERRLLVQLAPVAAGMEITITNWP